MDNPSIYDTDINFHQEVIRMGKFIVKKNAPDAPVEEVE